jgi:hypothetical protein
VDRKAPLCMQGSGALPRPVVPGWYRLMLPMSPDVSNHGGETLITPSERQRGVSLNSP